MITEKKKRFVRARTYSKKIKNGDSKFSDDDDASLKEIINRRRPEKSNNRRISIRPDADSSLKRVFAEIGIPKKAPFVPDPFQIEALNAIEKGDCLVTAPTGSGKTWIATEAILKFRKQDKKIWYASPLKALTNSKYAEFIELFGAKNVGILTGDRKENPDAPVIVGTTEILRNQLYDVMHKGETLDVNFVILDEAHFLGDSDRGVVWEEIMIYLPARVPLLLLSATIGNGKQIADWLSSIRGNECIVIEESKRPVPLYQLFLHPSGMLYPLVSKKDSYGKTRIFKKVSDFLNEGGYRHIAPNGKILPFGDILKVLKKFDLLPVIFFLKSRADCDAALEYCTKNHVEDEFRKERLSQRIKELISKNSPVSGHKQLWHLENFAVGAHHSGQLPTWKLIIENLMTEGLLDAVFATSTVAAGVNFPARTIVFLNSDKFNGKEFMPLTSTEFHQMSGRAGRRGMDQIGFAVTIPGRFMDIPLMARLSSAQPSDIVSQIKINFSMVLNLLLSHTPHQTEDLLKKSFATYLLINKKKKKRTESQIELDNYHKNLWRDFMRHLDFLIETEYVNENGELTQDGIWASQLRVDHPLMIAEGFRLGIFPQDDPVLLAAIMASFVNEKESDDKIEGKWIPNKLQKTFNKIKTSLEPFAKHMALSGFSVRSLHLRPASTIYNWAQGFSWENVLTIFEAAEGDLAMLILRTADNLRHIKGLRDVFPEAAETASKAIDLILKDPVVIEFEAN